MIGAWLARAGGTARVFGLSMIVLVPLILPAVKGGIGQSQTAMPSKEVGDEKDAGALGRL